MKRRGIGISVDRSYQHTRYEQLSKWTCNEVAQIGQVKE